MLTYLNPQFYLTKTHAQENTFNMQSYMTEISNLHVYKDGTSTVLHFLSGEKESE